jgi:phospholipid transport system substrate-binding protein
VIIDGISMAVTERQQFASIIQRNNGQIEALLKIMRERAGQA